MSGFGNFWNIWFIYDLWGVRIGPDPTRLGHGLQASVPVLNAML